MLWHEADAAKLTTPRRRPRRGRNASEHHPRDGSHSDTDVILPRRCGSLRSCGLITSIGSKHELTPSSLLHRRGRGTALRPSRSAAPHRTVSTVTHDSQAGDESGRDITQAHAARRQPAGYTLLAAQVSTPGTASPPAQPVAPAPVVRVGGHAHMPRLQWCLTSRSGRSWPALQHRPRSGGRVAAGRAGLARVADRLDSAR